MPFEDSELKSNMFWFAFRKNYWCCAWNKLQGQSLRKQRTLESQAITWMREKDYLDQKAVKMEVEYSDFECQCTHMYKCTWSSLLITNSFSVINMFFNFMSMSIYMCHFEIFLSLHISVVYSFFAEWYLIYVYYKLLMHSLSDRNLGYF